MNLFNEQWTNIGYPNYQNQPQPRVENIQDTIIRDEGNDVIPEIQSNNDSGHNMLQNNQSLQQVLMQDREIG